MRPDMAEESERRYEIAIVGIGHRRLLAHLEAERAAADPALVIFEFDPELMFARRDQGLWNFNTLRRDIWRQPLGHIDSGLLYVGDHD